MNPRVEIAGEEDYCHAVYGLMQSVFDVAPRSGTSGSDSGQPVIVITVAPKRRVTVSLRNGAHAADVTSLISYPLPAAPPIGGTPASSEFIESIIKRCEVEFSSSLGRRFYPTEDFQLAISRAFDQIKKILLPFRGATRPLASPDNEAFFSFVSEGLHMGSHANIRATTRISNKRGTEVTSLVVPIRVSTWQAYTFLFQGNSKAFNRIQFYLHGVLLGYLQSGSRSEIAPSQEPRNAADASSGLPMRPSYIANNCPGGHCIHISPRSVQLDLELSDETLYRFDTKLDHEILYPALSSLKRENIISGRSLTAKFIEEYHLTDSEQQLLTPFLPASVDGQLQSIPTQYAEVVGALTGELASFERRNLEILDIFSGSLAQHIPYLDTPRKTPGKIRVRLVDNRPVDAGILNNFDETFEFEDCTLPYFATKNELERFNIYKNINEAGAGQIFGENLERSNDTTRRYDLVVSNPPHNDAVKLLMANVGYRDNEGNTWPTGERMLDCIRRHADVFAIFLMNTEQDEQLHFLLDKLGEVFQAVYTLSLNNEVVAICSNRMREGIVNRALDRCIEGFQTRYLIPATSMSKAKFQRNDATTSTASGKVVIFTGPSAAGKDTLIDLILDRYRYKEIFVKPTQLTTRPPRPGERQQTGIEFTDEETFNALYRRGDVTRSRFGEHLYGTFLNHIKELVEAGRNAVLNMNVDGIKGIFERAGDLTWTRDQVLCIYVTAPDDVRRERLKQRSEGSISDDEFESRLADSKNYEDLASTLGISSESLVVVDNSSDSPEKALTQLEQALRVKGTIPSQAAAVSSRLSVSGYSISSAFAYYPDYTNEKSALTDAIYTLASAKGPDDSRPRRFMDIGAGAGQLTRALSRHFSETVAIEPALPMRRFLNENLRHELFQREVCTFSYRILSDSWEELTKGGSAIDSLGKFDLITMNHVYSFLRSNVKNVYQAAIALLKPAGKFVITYMGDGCNYEEAYEGMKVYLKYRGHWGDSSTQKIIEEIRRKRDADRRRKHYPSFDEIRRLFESICVSDDNIELHRSSLDTTVSLRIDPLYSALLKFLFGVYYEEMTSQDKRFLGAYLEQLGSGVIGHNQFNIVLRNELVMVSRRAEP